MCFRGKAGDLMVLEITPDHLIYFDPMHSFSNGVGYKDNDAKETSASLQFLRLLARSTECGATDTVPPRHQKAARELTVNDTIFVLLGKEGQRQRLVRSRVMRIECVLLRRGALTLYTDTGNFFVDGALCSNFGDFYPVLPGWRRDAVPFALFAAHRLAFALVPSEQTASALRWVMDTAVLPLLRFIQQSLRRG